MVRPTWPFAGANESQFGGGTFFVYREVVSASAALKNDEKFPPFTEKYEVERIIGRGGMGTVFEARHTRLGQRVAIKVLGDDLRMYPELVKRFEREARAASALSSPHAVRVFDIDQTEDGTPFFVMEMLTGRDLGHIVANDGAQPVGLAVRWIIEASDAIAEAHRLGIIHRDIKPSNLLLCDSGSIKVLDFGIAKSTGPTERAITIGVQPLGTPQYMSPEQVRCAKDVDGRTDIWSLGVTLYELVCGRPPFNHDSSAACIAAIVADAIPDPRTFTPDLPAEVAGVIMRALEKDATKRFKNVDEMVLALAPYGEQITPETPSWRVISTMRKAWAKNEATLDGVDHFEHVVDNSEVRARLIISDETVAPTATAAAVSAMTKLNPRRIRGALAIGAAAVFGLLALVVTPRFTTPQVDADTKPHVILGAFGRAGAIVADPVAKAAPLTEAVNPPAETEAAEAPATPEPPPSAVPVAAAPSDSVAAPRPMSHTRNVRVVGSDRPMHGGISNPGF